MDNLDISEHHEKKNSAINERVNPLFEISQKKKTSYTKIKGIQSKKLKIIEMKTAMR